jgi:hypothetical protein
VKQPDNVTSIARLRGKVDETGQTVSIDAPRRRKRKKGWRDRVGLIDLGLMSRLDLNGSEWRVLSTVMACVPEKGGSEAFCTLQEIADRHEIPLSSVSRAMKSLRDRRIIMKNDRRIGRWHVNAWLMYNGDFDSWNVEAEQDPEPIWSRGVDAMTGEIK